MFTPGPDVVPALFRAGDIGVSSEWRDLTYDWWPLLTADGVFTYSYLRDIFDKQRTLRPFILNPEGPPKQRIQRVLQRRTEYGVQGPEYLLETVGLVYTEVQRGPSPDPSRPRHTTVTSYVVGYLEQAVLNWSMVERVLDALMPGLAPPPPDERPDRRQKRAQAAIRSLALAGMLQNEDPEYLFEPDGAWVSLLPRLIQDERWAALFTYMHGVEALATYRRQARAWVELARRRTERLTQENNAIRDQLLAAQRRPAASMARMSREAEPPGSGILSLLSVPKASSVTEGALSQGAVPGGAGQSPRGHRVNWGASGTEMKLLQQAAGERDTGGVPAESQGADQTDHVNWRSGVEITIDSGTAHGSELRRDPRDTDGTLPNGALPAVARHLREAELTTARLDGYFWTAVREILEDDSGERYMYTAGERKAVQRLLAKRSIPIGVFLAALRALMTLPAHPRPQRLAGLLSQPCFHACVEEAMALVASRVVAPSGTGTWDDFMTAYRSIGQTSSLRNVSPIEWPLIAGLFERHPLECWEVLRRVQRITSTPDLSYEYLRRAVLNNQRAAAADALRPAQPRSARAAGGTTVASPEGHASSGGMSGADGVADPRRELLEREGINPRILTPGMTRELIHAWIDEADARGTAIERRAGWLAWGIRKERMPAEVPEVAPRVAAPRPSSRRRGSGTRERDNRSGGRDAGGHPPRPSLNQHVSAQPASRQVDAGLESAELWVAVLHQLAEQLPWSEFETWLSEAALLELEHGHAVVGAPNVFVREQIEHTYKAAVAAALCAACGRTVEVEVVIS